MVIRIPIPPPELHPNHRGHWMAKARATRKTRGLAMILARAAMPRGWVIPEAAMVKTRFFFKTRRRRDADNLLASLKATFDGIRDAGVIADDSGFRHLPIEIAIDPKDPRVEIEIIEIRGLVE